MAKKGLDEDRLKFFKGMGGSERSESDKGESELSESEKTEVKGAEPAISESDKSESGISESGKSESVVSESVLPESEGQMSATSESDKVGSAQSEPSKSASAASESDESESRTSESDIRIPARRGRRQASKIVLPKTRAPSSVPKIRAKKVDDSVLDLALSAALKSPKVSIYSPFVAAVIKCNELTTIGYKSSADSRELLEKALEQTYPDVCEKVRSRMENRG